MFRHVLFYENFVNGLSQDILNSNAICLYRRIWLVTILCKFLNLEAVTKGLSWKDPPSWKREIIHVTFTTIHKNIKKSLTCNLILAQNLSKLKRTRKEKVWSLRFKLEVFTWPHVVYVPKSSTTFFGILICVIFKPMDMQEYIFIFSIAL
jgi:hypothetical protein